MGDASFKYLSMRVIYKSFILLCILFISQTSFAIAIHDSQDIYNIGADSYLIKDIDNNIDFEKVKQTPESKFIKNENDTILLDHSSTPYWIKFKLNYFSKNGLDYKNWFLEIAATSLDELDIYIVEQGNSTSHHLGDKRPFSARPVQHNSYIVDFRTLSNKKTDVFIRVKKSAAIKLPIKIWSHEALFTNSQTLNYFAGICYGILFILGIYNFILFFVVKDKTHNYLAIYIVCMLICVMSYDGFTKLILWPNNIWWESRALFFWESIAIFWGIQFSRLFLKNELQHTLLDKFLNYGRFVVIAFAVTSLLFDANIYSIHLLIAYAVLSIWITKVGLHLNSPYEKVYFLLSWIQLYLVSASLFIGLFGFDTSFINKTYIYYSGVIAHGLFLSLALADRYRSIRVNKERAEFISISRLKRYKHLFNNSTAGMFECTHSGQLLYVNPALIKMFGYETELQMLDNNELFGTGVFFYKKDIYKYLRILIKNLHVNNFEFKFRKKNGEHGWASISSSLIPSTKSGSKYNIEGSIIDITASIERSKIEQKLIETEASANIKSQFLANSSHELRTPMNAIIGFTSLLQKTILTEKQSSYAEKVRVSAKGLLRLINDILDHSKLEAGEMQLEVINFTLDQITSEVIDVFSERFNDKGVELIVIKESSIPTNLKGDPLRISQVLINLINNALKFTNDGHVALIINYSELSPAQVNIKITISDTGIGIEPDRCQAIFEPYQQADTSVSSHYGGTGLGLSLCKKLIESMGGEINVSSAVGKGTDFEFNILVQVDEYQSIPMAQQGCYEALKEKSGFIIESNKLTRKQIQNELTTLGITSVAVSGGEMALQRLISLAECENYDFIIIERNLIDNNGINIIKDLKTESTTKDIPIILTSKTGFSDLSERDKNCGINEFLVKPIKNNLLLKALIKIFNLDYLEHTYNEFIQTDKYLNIFCEKDILLVEDNELNQELLIELLNETGVHIDVANTGMLALEMLQHKNYSLVLMDVQMPVLNGIETTKIIRQDYPELKKLPILALTANVLDVDHEECNKAGMEGFITKPIDFEDLINTLKVWLHISMGDGDGDGDGDANISSQLIDDKKSDCNSIDIEAGVRKLGGNKKLYFKILHDFINTYSEEKSNILQLVESEDFENLKIKIHSIKGLSFNLGLNLLGDIAHDIEKVLSNNPNKNIRVINDYISSFFNSLLTLEKQIVDIDVG